MAEQAISESAALPSSQAAHTPGPWAVHIDLEDDALWVHPPDPEANVICDLIPRRYEHDRVFDERIPVFTGEDIANAHLIAAAPELLEALAEVLATGLNGGNNYRLAMIAASQKALDDKTLARAEASERAVQKAWAAIKKARGAEA